jgi:hypothetical protein
MELSRIEKYKKLEKVKKVKTPKTTQFKLKLKHKALIAGVIGMGLTIGIITMLGNDKTVYTDDQAQTALDALYKDKNHSVIVDWDEDRFRQVLIEMTHQKVHAHKKDGALQMTNKNINTMLMVLDQHVGRERQAVLYRSEAYYRQVLRQWRLRDFSDVADQHNHLRDLQDITSEDSKASGVVSSNEENDFINAVFKNK